MRTSKISILALGIIAGLTSAVGTVLVVGTVLYYSEQTNRQGIAPVIEPRTATAGDSAVSDVVGQVLGVAVGGATPVDSFIKGSGPTLYYYAADGFRYVFPNDKTFGSWFADFGKVITVSDEELGRIAIKGNVTYRPGVRMVKIQTMPQVYVVDPGGQLRWVKTEALAQQLYGNDWNKKIDDIPDVFFANYHEGPPIENAGDYSPAAAARDTETINKDRGLPETPVTPRSNTHVGARTIPAQRPVVEVPVVPNTPPLAPLSTLPPVFTTPTLPTTATPTVVAIFTTPATPAVPAVPTTEPATPAIPAQPATPAVPPAQTSTSTPSAADTTAPSAPTNLTATAVSSSIINLAWTSSTDNTGVVGYRIYRQGVFLANFLTTNLGTLYYSDSGLTAVTSYTYTVVAYDVAGNVSTLSNPASATTSTAPPTTSTTLPAPTYIRADWLTSHSTYNYGRVGQRIIFQFPMDTIYATQTFRLYQKKPGESTFTRAGEFVGLSSTGCVNDVSRAIISGEWSLAGGGSCGSWALHRQNAGSTSWNPAFFTATSYTVGEYSYYVTAVDSTGREGTSSSIAKMVFLSPLSIQGPTEAQSPTSANPTFQWSTISGWPSSSVDYIIVISDNPYGSNPFWSTFLATSGSTQIKVYDGPTLDSTKRYQVYIYGLNRMVTQTETSYISIAQTIPQFWVTASDTTAPTVALSTPATGSTVSGSSVTVTATSVDNVGVIGLQFKLDSANLGAEVVATSGATVSSPTSVTWDTTTTANGSHTLSAVVRDAAGNTATASISVIVSNSMPPPAPLAGTNAGAYFGAGWPADKYDQSLRFNYDSASLLAVQSFRLYEKKPTDATFNLIDTFANPAPLATNCSGYVYGATWRLSYVCGPGFWSVYSRTSQPASNFIVGEYAYYVTAVNSTGAESAPSPTLKEYILEPTEILSPTGGQTTSSRTPTFQWAVVSGWSYSPYFYIQVYESTVLTQYVDVLYSKSVPVTLGYTTGSKLYDGPTLDPAKTYVLKIDVPGQVTRTGGVDSTIISMVKRLETFVVPP